MKNKCNIIKDILPLYVENLVSDDTRQFVDEHLNQCDDCKKHLELFKTDVYVEKPPQEIEGGIKAMKLVKKKITRKNLIIGIVTAISVLLLTLIGVFIMFFYGIPASSDDVSIRTEYQYSDDLYLNQELVFDIKLNEDNEMFVITEDIYETNHDGEKVWIGTIVNVRKSPVSRPYQSHRFVFGCTIDKKDIQIIKDEDFTVTFVFSDKEVTYSGLELGILKKQQDVKYY